MAARPDHLPARVVLRGGPDGWQYTIINRSGAEEHVDLGAMAASRWPPATRRGHDPEWWDASAGQVAADLREYLGLLLTDRCFDTFQMDAAVDWRSAGGDAGPWEGTITLAPPDPGRFPGHVPPFVVRLLPGQGADIDGTDLPFATPAMRAWSVLTDVAHRLGGEPPHASFMCGWADQRSVRIGRGQLSICTRRLDDGTERVGQIYAGRPPKWGGSPTLRADLDGIDLLGETAGDVLWLLGEVGLDPIDRAAAVHVPDAGLLLYREAPADDRFGAVAIEPPARG
ncbi:hypothetical protein NE236_02740 [Actinoallomurus purpureus]|uniref:hypothetical protein n=1 Tax=Actinoallomurus purpureus TaxID=478114 RepID=UPI0020924402|nr:hypothetical protein [Actinoallomurus purpureus]MCO6003886.1 hypothetical protein [Actinoallomurus purpureus]